MQSERRAEPLKQVARSFGTSYDSFFRAYKNGKIKVIRFGSRLFVPADEIARIQREGLGPIAGASAKRQTGQARRKASKARC